MVKKISIIGGGSWGTALAQLLAKNNIRVLVYVRDQQVRDGINDDQINSKYFPDFILSDLIRGTNDLKEAVSFAPHLVLAVPTNVTRNIMKKISPYISSEQTIVSTAKGLEEKTHLRNSEIIKKNCSARVAVLSGPTHSEEVIKGLPTAAVIAADKKKVAENIQTLFMSSSFRSYTNSDVIGVELGGAVKNIIAVATGIGDGLGYGDNSRAALLTRGLTEMSRLGIYLGGRSLTFAGLAGMGDLVVTCNSMHSRNRRFGINIGKGMSFEEALDSIDQVVEGVKTTRSIYSWVCQGDIDIELPITRQVYQVLFKNKDPLKAVDDLMLRGPKYELEKVVDEKDW